MTTLPQMDLKFQPAQTTTTLLHNQQDSARSLAKPPKELIQSKSLKQPPRRINCFQQTNGAMGKLADEA